MFFGPNWSAHKYRVRNGTKQIGFTFWWNSSRIGFQFNMGTHEIQIIRERD